MSIENIPEIPDDAKIMDILSLSAVIASLLRDEMSSESVNWQAEKSLYIKLVNMLHKFLMKGIEIERSK